MGRFLNEGILSQFHSSGKVVAEEVVSYFAGLGVFATLREQNFSAVFTLRRQVAKLRKGEIRTYRRKVKELSGPDLRELILIVSIAGRVFGVQLNLQGPL
jgi:hypothetical protein